MDGNYFYRERADTVNVPEYIGIIGAEKYTNNTKGFGMGPSSM